jgi:hypothetical protein
MTRTQPQLKKGDGVQLIRTFAGIVVGIRGIILRRFTFDPLYDVCFEGYARPRLVNKRDVAPAPPEASTA